MKSTIRFVELLDSAETFAGYKIDFDFKLYFSEVWHEKGGFDIVIGNPPYVKARDSSQKEERKIIESLFHSPYKMWDTYIPFIELGIRLNNLDVGYTTMIIPDTIGSAQYSEKLVKFIENNHFLDSIVFFPDQYVFDTASVRSKIVGIRKKHTTEESRRFKYIDQEFLAMPTSTGSDKYLYETSQLDLGDFSELKLGSVCYVSYGLRLNSHKEDPEKFKKKDLISDKKSKVHCKDYTEGKYLEPYLISKRFWLEWGTERVPNRLVRPTFPELYKPEKLLLARQKRVAAFSDSGTICDNTIIVAVLHNAIEGVNNRSIDKYYKNVSITREDGIVYSRNFDIKYLLSIINSEFTAYFLKYLTKGKLDVYPDDWKKVPVPDIDIESQKPFITLSDYLLFLASKEFNIEFNFFNAITNSIVIELFFKKELQQANKEILKHLMALKPINDSMSEEEKLAVIQGVFERLYDDNHPVKFAIETLDSIEEVRIIKEALK